MKNTYSTWPLKKYNKMAEQDTKTSFDEDDEGEGNTVLCEILPLAENVSAFIKRKPLLRDVDVLDCDEVLVQKVMGNYIIAKTILSNLQWQDKMVCRLVCTTWNSALLALKKEQLEPQDFTAISDSTLSYYKKSDNFYSEPLVVINFINCDFTISTECKYMKPCPCDHPCKMRHSLFDQIWSDCCSPKNCMLAISALYVSYLPLPQSITYEDMLDCHEFQESLNMVTGICIPNIPQVEFNIVNIDSDTKKQEFYDLVNKVSRTSIIKGLMVFVTENNVLSLEDDIVFLNYIKDVQPDVQYAFGGCIVENTLCGEKGIKNIIECINDGTDDFTCHDTSGNILSIAMFSVPKSFKPTEKNNFDMYSLVIDSNAWSDEKIHQTIDEFSSKVPRFEHSVVFKLSSDERTLMHETEQNYFRSKFPNTRLIGCYGYGELGENLPTLANPKQPVLKRHRGVHGPTFKMVHSYSTVFVYMGWGKILSQKNSV